MAARPFFMADWHQPIQQLHLVKKPFKMLQDIDFKQ
jgi:hypothetical protein